MNVIDWLLEPSEPSVRYRTLTELLDQEGTAEAKEARRLIPESAPVKKLLGGMHPDGYWLQKKSRTGELIGDGVEYGSFGTTHFCLSYCAELGLDREYPPVEKAAERYLSLQQDDGDWWMHLSCLYAYNIRTLVKLGYREDARVKRATRLMLGVQRPDGGYLCDIHEKPNRKPRKSCIRGSVKALMAFAELPEYWDSERCLLLVDYFLHRNGIYKTTDHTRFVNDDMKGDSFPVIWRTNIWEILYAMSKMCYGKDERLKDAWLVLDSRMDAAGRFRLDWTPPKSPWKVGRRGEENKWVTLYCMLAKKYAGI